MEQAFPVVDSRGASDSLHSRDEIDARLVELRADGFHPGDAAFFLDGLASFCRNAEDALAECVEHLDEPTLERELAGRLFTGWRRLSPPGESRHSLRIWILAELAARSCTVVNAPEWSVALPDGTQVDQIIRAVPGDSSTTRLARLALLVAGIVTMREHPPIAPCY